ncbi:hypothetical protein JL721_8671 [Aureococcus anophagefferens]|nr:hypothetical protein JL721_8671 [Aureococcus anophagefferens]
MGGMRAGEAPYHAPYYVPYPPPPGAYAAPAHGPGMPYYPVRDCGGDPAYPYKRARRAQRRRPARNRAGDHRPSTGRQASAAGGSDPERRTRSPRCRSRPSSAAAPAPAAGDAVHHLDAAGAAAATVGRRRRPPPPLKARERTASAVSAASSEPALERTAAAATATMSDYEREWIAAARGAGDAIAGEDPDALRDSLRKATEARHTGVVRWYTEKKHYGFIESKGASATDLFVHSSELEEPLRAGDTVSFVIGERRGRSAATKVEVVERAPLPPPAQSALDPYQAAYLPPPPAPAAARRGAGERSAAGLESLKFASRRRVRGHRART